MNYIIPFFVMLFNLLILMYPSEIIGASKEGLGLWFNNVLPSLVPFIIGTNILDGLGVIHFLGVLLSPIMYPMFGVSGAGGFALIAGMTSGYPMGAKITAALRERNDISQTEAQRLLSFVNNSGPLFILGAVGVGMFKSEKIGYFIMIVHYSAALITGLLFKYYRYGREHKNPDNRRLLSRALRSMSEGRKRDGRSFGRLLGDSVRNTMETVVQIGGFIILFCVIVKIFEIMDLFGFIQTVLKPAASYFRIDRNIFKGVFVGLLEMTNGAKLLAQESISGFQTQGIVAACGILSFGGLSIHAQSAVFLSRTDVRVGFYILSKCFNGILAMIIAWLLIPFFDFGKDTAAVQVSAMYGGNVVDKLAYSSVWFLMSFALILIFIVFYNVLRIWARK